MLPNRVDGTADDILPLNKPRLKAVTSETGAQTIVTYLDADCTAAGTKPKLDENTRRCYPVYWSPNGEKDPGSTGSRSTRSAPCPPLTPTAAPKPCSTATSTAAAARGTTTRTR
ncbi:hypothetical protein ACFQ3Z_45390 [Streptomyces nogalater]